MAPVIYRRQRDILDFISQYMQKHGYAPTLPEICDGVGVNSPATVHEHIKNLAKKGVLKKVEGVRRGIEIIDQKMAGWIGGGIEVPLVGYIAAGTPIEAIENSTETLEIPKDMVGRGRTYVLRVKGQSMIEASIQDGDYVVVEQKQTAMDGDIVVALLNDNFATLKRFFREKDCIRLEPANSSMNAIRSKSVRIQGRVIGVIRKYS
ncbi:MAG: repressor LexA [Candidatus Woykebacteria bacterium RIFCSPHIGHO2_12_FULL_43_10]|uniref:LexA repressor n=2 Tax=Candidatus Woykeibacteriota TaxID=1817899 RepID=A0A1G1WXC6_9BACT|nr:MAG: repressor LexA [Candidatus Woykebacteria bacterium RIFCSPHIGHO2_02_FULL_43_16b]OGY29832.1 MAG: repressor LexA [Candidatus Woykebacteria bacterium RIFCSPHIGHO2_12_FULL_43_10]OGY32354.1 MAG: repressor LexA [Candidatus Woykebacteria bacterium RIFCSPLOWO2_01_FULL_43_14]